MSGISIIVVKTPDNFAYYYRGANSNLFVSPSSACFGDQVDLDETIAMHLSPKSKIMTGNFVPNDFSKVIYKDTLMDISSLTIDVLRDEFVWNDIAAQISVCFSASQIILSRRRSFKYNGTR